MRFWDFGIPVEIEVPGPDEITDQAVTHPPPTTTTGEAVDLPDPWFVTGENGTDETYLIVSGPESPFSVTCVRGLPFPARVTIRDEESGRPVHTFPRKDMLPEDRFDGCMESPAIVGELLDHPERFTLRLHIESGWGDVPMRTSHRGDPPPE